MAGAMDSRVSLDEAAAWVRKMRVNHERIVAVRRIDSTTFGPIPFFLDEAEITISFDGGEIEAVDSVRVDRRFGSFADWNADILDAWDDDEIEALRRALSRIPARSA